MMEKSVHFTVLALLAHFNVYSHKFKTHVFLLEKAFDHDASILTDLGKACFEKQYYEDSALTKKDIRDLGFRARTFYTQIDELIDSLTPEQELAYKKEITKLLKKANEA